jgi:HK97 family phage major capsid protein
MAKATVYRSTKINDRGLADKDSRSIEIAFSSETACERSFGNEILDHSPGSVDLTRLNNSHPLLLNHDTDKQIGVVEKAWIDKDKVGRAKVRFGNSPLAQEIWQDVQDGIRQLVSVGYRYDRELTAEGQNGSKTIRFAWTPLELSIVPVPYDTTVGVGRAETENTLTERKQMETNVPAAPAPAVPAPSLNEATIREDAIKSFRKTCEEIDGIAKRLEGKVDKIEELAAQARNAGWTVEQFRAEAMNRLPAATPLRNAEPLDVKPKDWAKYSIVRAIRGTMPGQKLEGMERELSDEISMRGGKRPEGVWVPPEAMVLAGKRNFIAGTGTLGGMLVQTDNLGSQFIELLRNRALVAKLGARMLNLSNPVTIPRQNAAGSVNWVGETVAATLSAGNFTQLTLTPQGVSAFQQYGKQLLFENDPSIDALVRDDIMNIIALEIDRVCLHGTGSGQPTGITATTGVTTIALGANGAAFSVANARAAVISLETAVSVANADIGNLAYVTNAKMRGRLKQIDQSQATNTARWVWENDGTVNSYSAQVTQQVSAIQTQGTATTIASSVFFGNWTDILVASFNGGATDLVVDPYTLAANAVIRIIARHWADVAIRHPASFSVLLGCLDA